MRDILLAGALTWCLWLTWDIHHNYKQDQRSEIIDKCTLKVLQGHEKRIMKIEKRLKDDGGRTKDRTNEGND